MVPSCNCFSCKHLHLLLDSDSLARCALLSCFAFCCFSCRMCNGYLQCGQAVTSTRGLPKDPNLRQRIARNSLSVLQEASSSWDGNQERQELSEIMILFGRKIAADSNCTQEGFIRDRSRGSSTSRMGSAFLCSDPFQRRLLDGTRDEYRIIWDPLDAGGPITACPAEYPGRHSQACQETNARRHRARLELAMLGPMTA